MNSFLKWLQNKDINENKVNQIAEALDDFTYYLKEQNLLLCEVKDQTIADWIRHKTKNKRNSFYHYFELLSYPIEFYQEKNVEINFKLTNVYLILKHKKFKNEMFRLHIDDLLTKFKEQQIDYEYKFNFNESNAGLDFKVNNNKIIRVAYAEFEEDEKSYILNKNFNIKDYDYFLVSCLSNEKIKRILIIPREFMNIFDNGYYYKFEINNHKLFEFEDWNQLKIS